jgi:CRISPR-associated protein Csd1
VALDKQNTNPAYRLGRLFALFEWAETGAGKRNATIRDKYFAAASTTPARVFPLLMRGSTHNLAKLRKGSSTGLAVLLDREITEVLSGLDDQLPTSLRLEEQGRFVIGYYHQTKARFGGKAADSDAETGMTLSISLMSPTATRMATQTPATSRGLTPKRTRDW